MVQVYANILGANTADSDPGVHLFFENKRYIFSAGEGSLRFCNEHKVRFGKIENFFFSQLSHKTLGGLPGLIMTITDHGKNSISLHGPKNLLNYVQSLRFCLMRSDLKLEINEIDRPGLVFEDENLKVKAVPIAVKHVIQKKMDSKQVVHKFTLNGISKEYIEEKIEIPDEQPIKKVKHDQNAQYSIVPPPTPVDIAVSYICHTPDSRGKFDPSKAKQLGLKPGPLFQKLQNGEKVTLEDGRVIESSQVLGPSSRGTILIIVACPSREYMKELLESEEWTEYYSMNVGFVVHQTPSNVFEDVEYQNWIFKFGNKTAHIISNSEYCSNRVSFQDSATLQCKLNLIDSEIFPLVDQSVNK
jgi:ribonuclease Z